MKELVNRLVGLLQDSTITQSILVITVFGTIVYCVVFRIPIPDLLDKYGFLIVGYFFGAKSTYQVLKGLGK